MFANSANSKKFFKISQGWLKTYEESNETTYNEISWAKKGCEWSDWLRFCNRHKKCFGAGPLLYGNLAAAFWNTDVSGIESRNAFFNHNYARFMCFSYCFGILMALSSEDNRICDLPNYHRCLLILYSFFQPPLLSVMSTQAKSIRKSKVPKAQHNQL